MRRILMRRILILVESARRKNRFRHGGDLVRVDFDEFNTEGARGFTGP